MPPILVLKKLPRTTCSVWVQTATKLSTSTVSRATLTACRVGLPALVLLVSALAGLPGCGSGTAAIDSPDQPDQAEAAGEASETASVEGPEEVCRRFLAAVRDGNKEIAREAMTRQVIEGAQEQGVVVDPPGKEGAEFRIRDVKVLEDYAKVEVSWKDPPTLGTQPEEDTMTWLLRREPMGWRIYGMSFQQSPDLAPEVINFERTDEMLDRQERIYRESLQASRTQVPQPQPSRKGQPPSQDPSRSPASLAQQPDPEAGPRR